MRDVAAHAACRNCDTPLAGRWCHACGQDGHLGRSVPHLLAELFEALTHADSRFWRTLRRLALDPGRLSGDYIDGRRASEIPPLRLFLVALFLLFGIGALTGGRIDLHRLADPQVHDELVASVRTLSLHGHLPWLESWLRARLLGAAGDPAEVLSVIRDWLERFAILLFPIVAGTLWLLHLGRRIPLYDHLIVSLHALGFACLLLSAVLLARTVLPAANLLVLLLPVHLFRHLRGVTAPAYSPPCCAWRCWVPPRCWRCWR